MSSWGALEQVAADLLMMMAGDQVSVTTVIERWGRFAAGIVSVGAAWVKIATARRVDR